MQEQLIAPQMEFEESQEQLQSNSVPAWSNS